MSRVFVIAEAGVNHNGSLALARRLVEEAARAGAGAVKFQTFRAERLVCREAPKADYQKRSTGRSGSQFEMLKALELSEADHRILAGLCSRRGIRFLSTPFDAESLRFLVDDIHVPLLKLGSGEITNAPLLLEAGRARRPLILSTGMSTLPEVRRALAVLAFGYSRRGEPTLNGSFERALRDPRGLAALRRRVTLLHCTTEYPAPVAEANLRAMDTLREEFGLEVGLSDHCEGIAVSLAAVARGASVIEKHFTLDRNLPGPDHRASLDPEGLRLLVEGIRQVEASLGSGRKRPTPSERKNLPVARRSLVAARTIWKGEPFTESNLAVKRPGTGRSPFDYWSLLGKRARRSYRPDERIEEGP